MFTQNAIPSGRPVNLPEGESKGVYWIAQRLVELLEAELNFKVEEKDERAQYHTKEIYAHLQALLSVLKEEAEKKAIEGRVEKLRTALARAMDEKERVMGDKIYHLQRILTRYWMRNDKNEQGVPLDTIWGEEIPLEQRVESAAGYIYNKDFLKKYFKQYTSFEQIKKVGFAVLERPPADDNLPENPNSCYVLVQTAPGREPTGLWFVDRSRVENKPRISEIQLPPGCSPLSFARNLFPEAANYDYPNIAVLWFNQQANIIRHIGAEQIIKYRIPEGSWFNARDITHFKAQGLEIAELNLQLYTRLLVNRFLGQSLLSNIIASILEDIFIEGAHGHFYRYRGSYLGAAGGFVGGIFAGLIVTGVLINPFFATLTKVHFLVAAGIGVASGSVRRHQDRGFWGRFLSATLVSLLLQGVAAYFAPIILPVLGVVSAASLAASTVWIYGILPAIPLLTAAALGVREYFKPGSMHEFYTGLISRILDISVTGGAVCGAVLGGLCGFLFRDLPLRLMARFNSPRPEGAVSSVPQQERRNDLSANARVHQVVSSHGAIPVPVQAEEAGNSVSDRYSSIARVFGHPVARMFNSAERLAASAPDGQAVVAQESNNVAHRA